MISQIDEIKDRLDIVKIISDYLPLRKVGTNYRSQCPFHSEKNPSFYVSPARQIFKCFGCNKGGNIFNFIMEIEKIDFREALQILAKKAGVALKRESIKIKGEKQKLYEICELATRFFQKQLENTKRGKEARLYLLKRGIDEDLIKEWRLGYAPDTLRGLTDFLISRGYNREEIINAGLVIKKENQDKEGRGSFYDRFRKRIIFPIFDLQNNVIGFGGRIFERKSDSNFKSGKQISDKEAAKYINTPNTLIYDKSRVLYGLNSAKTEIIKKNECILVEGYTDVILGHKAGTKNIISLSGTALTWHQSKTLSRYTKNLLFAFDTDPGGEEATRRGIDLAQSQGFNIKIINLSKNEDPAKLIEKSPEKWKKLINKAEEIINFYFRESISRFDKNTIEGKKKITEIVLPFISKIQNKIELASWIQKLAAELSIEEKAIWEEMKRKEKEKNKNDLPEKISEEKTLLIKDREREIEEWFLTLILKCPDILKKLKKMPKFSFKEGQELISALKDKKQLSEELNDFISELELRFEADPLLSPFKESKNELEKEVLISFSILKKIKKEKKLSKLREKLKEAEKNRKEEIPEILKEIKKII